MILVKENVKRNLTNPETIKLFLEAGWTEQKTVVKPIEKIEKTKKDEDK